MRIAYRTYTKSRTGLTGRTSIQLRILEASHDFSTLNMELHLQLFR